MFLIKIDLSATSRSAKVSRELNLKRRDRLTDADVLAIGALQGQGFVGRHGDVVED
jgi:hypothetical protein